MSSNRSLSVLRAILPSSTKLDVIEQSGMQTLVKIASQRARVLWVGEGWRAQVKPALESVDVQCPTIFVARKMSPGAQELLRNEQVNWADEIGNAEIAIGPLIVSRIGRSAVSKKKLERWTPAVLTVAEALLCGQKATVSSMADTTQLSVGSCVNALRFLTERGHLKSNQIRGSKSARFVTNQEQLLEDYASQSALFSSKPSLSIGVSWKGPERELAKIGKTWTQAKLKWAITGELASAILAPHLTQIATYEVYLNVETLAELEALCRRLNLRPLPGGRLTLKAAPTKISDRLVTEKNGLNIAPWPRVYADLRNTGVRGEEAAEHLKEVITHEHWV